MQVKISKYEEKNTTGLSPSITQNESCRPSFNNIIMDDSALFHKSLKQRFFIDELR